MPQNFVLFLALLILTAPGTRFFVPDTDADRVKTIEEPATARPVVPDGNNAEDAVDQSPEQVRRERIAQCLAIYYTKPVNADRLRPWSIMHGLIAYGQQSRVMHRGKATSALDHLCNNETGYDMKLLSVQNGKLRVAKGVGVQGHSGQFLAILAQSGVLLEHPIHVGGQSFEVRNLVETEQAAVRSGEELTFWLLGLANYVHPDAQWKNGLGETWSIGRLLKEEAAQPVEKGACGGTHRLMALSHAVSVRKSLELPVAGPWHTAERVLDVYEKRAWTLQNADGSFSTQFFEMPEQSSDPMRQLYSTGHIAEWLIYHLPPERMSDARLVAAIDFLLDLMLSAPDYQLDIGPCGHALHALAMYENKAYRKSSDYGRLLEVENLTAVIPPIADPGFTERIAGGYRLKNTGVPVRPASTRPNQNPTNDSTRQRGIFRRR